MSVYDICIVKSTIFITVEADMKQWFVSNILSVNTMEMFESGPISNREFTISLTMVFLALSVFGIVVRAFGA
jgi:hypothetical protein